MRFLYNTFLYLGIVWGLPLILAHIMTSDKRRKTVMQRLGLATISARLGRIRWRHPLKKPIWVHALSVGEVLSAVPLVEKLTAYYEDRDVVVSVSTQTGFEVAGSRFKEMATAVFFYPYDFNFSVRRIVEKIGPAIVVVVESDIWPNFLFEMKKRRTPVILVNARMSKRSFSGYRRVASFSKPLFLSFDNICAQSEPDAGRFAALGVPPGRITVSGNIKFDQKERPLTATHIDGFRNKIQVKPSQRVILAGSTHNGEESILLDVFSRLKVAFDDLLLVVAPRDPQRGRTVQHMFHAAGFVAVLLEATSKKEMAPHKRVDVVVVDIIGVLKSLYAMADIAFVGGSLVNSGGHNPLEPAAFAKPVLFGQDMSDFAEIADMLLASGGAVRVKDADGLFQAVSTLLSEPQKAHRMGRSAYHVFCVNQGAVDKTLKVVQSALYN